jgi:Uma2 family endonuclease
MRSAARLQRAMRFDEFLGFLSERPDGERWELVDGVPVMNAQPTDFHQAIAENVILYLRAHRRKEGANWMAIGSSAIPIPGENRSRCPDVTVKRALTGTQFTPDPIAVFEVLSPSNGPQDLRERLDNYRKVASLQLYVVLHQERPVAVLHRREDNWRAEEIGPAEGSVELGALGVRMSLSAAYADTNLEYFFLRGTEGRPAR